MQTFPILTAGAAALRGLAPARSLRVLAVFQRTFYCEGHERALVCVGPAGIGAGPLNAIVSLPEGLEWPALGLSPGAPASSDGRTLRVNGRLCFDLGWACPWRPAPLIHPVGAPRLAAGLAALGVALGARPRLEGLGPLITPLAAPAADLPDDLPDASLLVRAAWRGIRPLAGWLTRVLHDPAGQAPPPPAETQGLIGLGPGLTPSGDDCLGGALIALHALGARAAADRLGRWVLSRAGDRTHRISRGHLACAVGGEGAAALHETLAALCAPGAPDLDRCLDALGRIGHSSGYDALTGVVAATRAVAGRTGRSKDLTEPYPRVPAEGRAPAARLGRATATE
jgi:hypothetical protein